MDDNGYCWWIPTDFVPPSGSIRRWWRHSHHWLHPPRGRWRAWQAPLCGWPKKIWGWGRPMGNVSHLPNIRYHINGYKWSQLRNSSKFPSTMVFQGCFIGAWDGMSPIRKSLEMAAGWPGEPIQMVGRIQWWLVGMHWKYPTDPNSYFCFSECQLTLGCPRGDDTFLHEWWISQNCTR